MEIRITYIAKSLFYIFTNDNRLYLYTHPAGETPYRLE